MYEGVFPYRHNFVKKLKDISVKHNYNFKCDNNLHKEKDKILERTKIVIHVASLPDVKTMPWAKITELMCKRVFVMIPFTEESCMVPRSFILAFYHYDDNGTNIEEKIDYWLMHPIERMKIIDCCYNYIQKFNTSKILSALINRTPFIPISYPNLKISVKKIKYFDYGVDNFHSQLKNNYCKFMETNSMHVFKEYSTEMWNCETNHIIQSNLTQHLNNYLQDDESMYIFNAEDIFFLFWILTPDNINLVYKFLSTTKYVVWCYEVITDNSLLTVGLTSPWLTKYAESFSYNERSKMLIYLYSNARAIYACSSSNIKYLSIYNKNNICFFPPFIYNKNNTPTTSISNNVIPQDCIFYGYISDCVDYRHKKIEHIRTILNDENIMFSTFNGTLHGSDKIKILSQTKIVLHIPSVSKLHTIPWAKIEELMMLKVFFIIEECEEMYTEKLNELLVFYKQEDTEDLIKKIKYYLKHDDERQNVIERCYNYFNTNFNHSLLLTIISSI